MTTLATDSRRDVSSPLTLWFGVLAGPAAWATQLALGDLFSELGCESGGFDGLTLVLLLLAVLTVAVAVAALVVALMSLRRVERAGEAAAHAERTRFMAFIGILSSSLFILLIAVGGFVPHLFLGTCGP